MMYNFRIWHILITMFIKCSKAPWNLKPYVIKLINNINIRQIMFIGVDIKIFNWM